MSRRTHLIFDLETTPDHEIYAPGEHAAGADRPIPPVWAQRPIAIGVLWLDRDYSFKRLGIVGEDRAVQDERTMLEDFVAFVERHRPRLVTFNGRGFDLPVIAHRCLRHGLCMPWYYGDRGYRYRYSDDAHVDLCDFLSDHGAARYLSLNAAARLIGLPGKMDVDGSHVETLYRSGQVDLVRSYCLADVAQTAFLYLRFRLLQGGLSRDEYRAAAEGLHAALSADGRLAELLERTDTASLLLADAAPAALAVESVAGDK